MKKKELQKKYKELASDVKDLQEFTDYLDSSITGLKLRLYLVENPSWEEVSIDTDAKQQDLQNMLDKGLL